MNIGYDEVRGSIFTLVQFLALPMAVYLAWEFAPRILAFMQSLMSAGGFSVSFGGSKKGSGKRPDGARTKKGGDS